MYPLPNIGECLDTQSEKQWFSKLDANLADWQMRIHEEDRKTTAFIAKYGLYEFVRMEFGLRNAPATFSAGHGPHSMRLDRDIILAFLNDMVVLGKSFKDHMDIHRKVLQCFREFQLKLKPRKCEIFQKIVEFLGHNVGVNQISLKPDHVEAVRN